MVTTVTPQIVNEVVNVQYAPEPSQLQQSGALVSAGGSTLGAGKYQYCGSLSALQAILAAPLPITSLTWASGVVTATVAAMTLAVGQTFTVTIAGAVPAAYNGTFVATVATSTTFTYDLTTDPGTETSPGTYTPPYSAFLNGAATTFFAQGNVVGLYVLELGPETDASTAITALGTWITDNPGLFYAYMTAESWDSEAASLSTLAGDYSSNTGQTYFVATTTSSTISNYGPNKSLYCFVPSPTAPVGEYGAAADFYNIVVNNPGATNKLKNMAYRFVYGVTGWPKTGYTTEINTVLTAYGNIHMSLTQAGITEVGIFKGTVMSGIQFSSWYGIDWYEINAQLNVTNAVVNGSNQQPPILYDQNGINSLEIVAQDTANSGISFGCLQAAACSATDFYTYTAANPSNYQDGIYNGLLCQGTAQVGFLTIGFTINVNFSPS